jgi:membrane-associated phospholipid phosphatase
MDTQRRPWWKVPPLDGRGVGMIAGTYVVMAALTTLVGLAIVEWWDDGRGGEWDGDVNRWFEDRRTDTWTTLSHWGSGLSDTFTKIVLCALLLPLFLWMFRRWHDWTMIVGGLLLEVSIFVTSATLVGRDRPPVEQLDNVPTNSFPSGHIAASVVFYAGLAIVVRWHTHNRFVRGVFAVIAVLVPTTVMISRLYRGMHYPTDAAAGVVIGIVSLLILRAAVLRTIHRVDTAAAPIPDVVHPVTPPTETARVPAGSDAIGPARGTSEERDVLSETS